jgi:SOS-response transcriptional repressor LexA
MFCTNGYTEQMSKIPSGLPERILFFIIEYHKEHGYAPSVREIAAALEVGSTNTVNYHLDRLAASGYIMRQKRISRGITVIRGGDDQTLHSVWTEAGDCGNCDDIPGRNEGMND